MESATVELGAPFQLLNGHTTVPFAGIPNNLETAMTQINLCPFIYKYGALRNTRQSAKDFGITSKFLQGGMDNDL